MTDRSAAAQVRHDLLESFTQTWTTIDDRLQGLTVDEYLWAPTDGCWTVHAASAPDAGPAMVDWADDDPTPAPVTTIAWRIWHMAVDCLDSYASRTVGRPASGFRGRAWTADPDVARTSLERAWSNFRSGFEMAEPERLFDLLGPAWGPFATSTNLALGLHAQREIVHHGAEIALLRDLFAHGAGT